MIMSTEQTEYTHEDVKRAIEEVKKHGYGHIEIVVQRGIIKTIHKTETSHIK